MHTQICSLQTVGMGPVSARGAAAVPPVSCRAAARVGPYRGLHQPHGQCIGLHQRQRQQQHRRRHLTQRLAGPIDAAPTWTLDQIAGLAFGVVMLAFYFGSKEVDVFIAKQQRKQLGLCERCGGLYDPASCSQGNCPMKS